MTELPLFPLHSVLCPGVALPLHIFEPRYRLMIGHCIDRNQPFGVVLIREGREVGPHRGHLADVGTTALIRQAGRYPDGDLDLMVVGGQRFRVEALDGDREPYLVGHVTLLDEPLGAPEDAELVAERVGRRFLRYLELLQPTLDDDGPEIKIELEIETAEQPDVRTADETGGADADAQPDVVEVTDEDRHRLLITAARRLTEPSDPTGLSYVLTGLVEVELPRRQQLLEAPDTASRLRLLDRLLWREIQLLGRGLKPLVLAPGSGSRRRN